MTCVIQSDMDKPVSVPVHVSFIMDGNGRWAKAQGKDRIFGHFEGVESVRAVVEASVDWGVKYVSFYAFSEENWNRPSLEVNGLMSLMMKEMKKELPLFTSNGIRFVVLGNRERLSGELNAAIDGIMEATASGEKMTAIFFISYSGKWDIEQAAAKMARDLNDGKETGDFSSYLVTAGIPDPDLMIRTSGEKRISNYMLWQMAYTEFVFTDVLWPDFRRPQYLAALNEFGARDRRFGKVK